MPSAVPGLLRVGIHGAFVTGDTWLALDPLHRRVVDWFYPRYGIPESVVDGYHSSRGDGDKLTTYDWHQWERMKKAKYQEQDTKKHS